MFLAGGFRKKKIKIARFLSRIASHQISAPTHRPLTFLAPKSHSLLEMCRCMRPIPAFRLVRMHARVKRVKASETTFRAHRPSPNARGQKTGAKFVLRCIFGLFLPPNLGRDEKGVKNGKPPSQTHFSPFLKPPKFRGPTPPIHSTHPLHQSCPPAMGVCSKKIEKRTRPTCLRWKTFPNNPTGNRKADRTSSLSDRERG